MAQNYIHPENIEFLSCSVILSTTLVEHGVYAASSSQKSNHFCTMVNLSGITNWCWIFCPKCLG